MSKEELREQLFNKYFEEKNGVLVTHLVDKLSFINNVYKELCMLCMNNIDYFDFSSYVEMVKIVDKYFILKLRTLRYVIINLETMQNVSKKEFDLVDEELFIKYFGERKIGKEMYSLYEYEGNINKLIDFYICNIDVFDLPTKIYWKNEINDAYTYFVIDFATGSALMAFHTPDQFLYEHLFMNYDLTPSGLQDAQDRIGIEKMHEMFAKIERIKIPIDIIPEDLYNEYLVQCNELTLKKK